MKPSGRAAVSYTSAVVSPQEAVPMPSLAACLLAVALAAPPKPVARLYVATKDVKVWHGKEQRDAAKDLPLERDDEVDVPVGGFALVRITRNDQLVRIDEDLRLAVRDLAALDAPKATASLEAQVNALLTSAERDAKGSERMVGWYVAPTAAQVQTASGLEAPSDKLLAEDALVTKTPAPGRARGTLGGGKADRDVLSRGKRESAAEEKPRLERDEAPPPTPQPVSPSAGAAPGGPSAVPSPPPPPPLAMDDATRGCVRASLDKLGANAFRRIGPTVTVRLRHGEGRVVVFLEGGVPVDACVQDWANRQAASLPAQGWAVLEVPLQ